MRTQLRLSDFVHKSASFATSCRSASHSRIIRLKEELFVRQIVIAHEIGYCVQKKREFEQKVFYHANKKAKK